MVFCLTKQGNKMTGFCLKQSQGLKVFSVERVRFFPSQLVKCSTTLQSYHCSITVRLSKDSCGVWSKAYLDKLNGRAACNIEGRSMETEELKSTLAGPAYTHAEIISNASQSISVFTEQRLRTYFQSLGKRTVSMTITPEADICCALPSQKLPNTKVASE